MVNLFIDILEMSIPVSVLILLLLMLSPFLKRAYVSKWRYYMWLFVAIRLLIPVRLGFKSAVTVSLPQGITLAQGTANTNTLSPVMIPALMWVAGIAAFAVYRTVCYISFKRLVKRWQSDITDTDVLEEFRAAKDFAGVKRNIKIVRCKAVTTPMVFGLLQPVLLMPEVDFTRDELRIVLKHELVHVRRSDILYKLIITAAATVYWFNPLMYVMARAANRDLELACDAEVVRNKNSDYRRRYCEAIMRLVHGKRGAKTVLSTCFIFSKKTVMERFKYILDEKIKRNGIVMFCVVALSVVLSGGAVSFATEQVAESLEENFQILEREEEPAPEVVPSAVPTAEPAQAENDEPIRERNTGRDTVKSGEYTYTEEYTYTPSETTYNQPVYEEPEIQQPESEQETTSEAADANDISTRITGDAEVSSDGSRVTYELNDGSKAVVQYDGDTVDSGYILVN